jgi:fumarate hydratase class II
MQCSSALLHFGDDREIGIRLATRLGETNVRKLRNLLQSRKGKIKMKVFAKVTTRNIRKETDSMDEVDVHADVLWGAQTQRSLEHFSIGHDPIPREMIAAFATVKKAAGNVNNVAGRLSDRQFSLIVQTCDEILNRFHQDMFSLHVWMTGSGTQFNMNVNELISNRCCQIAGTPVGSKTLVHPNDQVNIWQSSNYSLPTAMNIAAAVNVTSRLLPG